MAKRPAPGEVKTRLCPPFAPEEAAELYAAMLDDVLHTSADAARRAGAALWLAAHPPDALDELAARCPEGAALRPQRGADLGARMERAVADAAEALLAGLEALDGCDLAVGPDADGGYAWIALRRPQPGLFAHPMSTATVLRDTLARAAAAGLRCRRLAPTFDLDTAGDLAHLARARRWGEAGACPRTLAVLDARDHWRHLRSWA